MLKILIIEDEPSMLSGLHDNLEFEGYAVNIANRGDDGLAKILKESYDLILLDVMLPGISGFDILKQCRGKGITTPIIMLTAKAEELDKVLGLEFGADDYITKPFSFEELLLRIKAILRRVNDVPSQEVIEFNIGKYIFNWEKQTLKSGNSKEVLTSKESDLLKILCINMNKITEREFVLKNIWGDDTYFNARSMDVYISKLRKYLKDDPDVTLQNIHGKGYKLMTTQK